MRYERVGVDRWKKEKDMGEFDEKEIEVEDDGGFKVSIKERLWEKRIIEFVGMEMESVGDLR